MKPFPWDATDWGVASVGPTSTVTETTSNSLRDTDPTATTRGRNWKATFQDFRLSRVNKGTLEGHFEVFYSGCRLHQFAGPSSPLSCTPAIVFLASCPAEINSYGQKL